MGLLGTIFKVVAAVVLVVIGLLAFLYFTDYEAHATVTSTGKDAQGDYVVVAPTLWPSYHYTYHFTSDQEKYAPFVCKGYDVAFHINTHAMRVTDKSGRVVYDSKDNTISVAGLAACASTNVV